MASSLTYFPVSGDFRNVADPLISGSTDVPDVEIIEGLVTFFPRLPVGFVAYINDYLLEPATSEVQTLTLTGATGGTFKITYAGQQTSAIAYNASASTVQTALQALSTIGSGNAAVTGSAGGPYTITFQGALANQAIAIMTIDATALTGVAATVTVATATPGVAAVNAVQTVTVTGSPTSGTFTLTYAGQTTGAIAYNAAASAVQSALQALTSIGSGNVSVTGTGPYTVTFVGALGGQYISPLSATASLSGGSSPNVTVTQTTTGVNAVNEVQTVTLANAVGGTFTLTFSGQTTAAIPYGATALTVQSALTALSNVGAGNVSVTGPTGGQYVVTFQGTLGGTNVAQMTASAASLTGPTPTSNIVHTTYGTAQVSRDTAVAIPPRKGRIWNGQLSTIDVVDTPGVELVADSVELALQLQGFTHLIYDVQFSSVTYAGGTQTLKNFSFVAPTDSTPICITDPALVRMDYQGPP